MVKTSEMTGDLSGTLDEMADYYTEIEKTRNEINEELEKIKTQLLQLKSARELTIESYKKE